MTYEIFKEELISLLEERMEADWSLDVRPVLKNNDLWLDGLSILQSSVNISPTIYLNTCYDYYLQGTTIEEVADNVFANLMGNQMQENVDLSFLTDFAKVQEHIIFKLISMKQNQELLRLYHTLIWRLFFATTSGQMIFCRRAKERVMLPFSFETIC